MLFDCGVLQPQLKDIALLVEASHTISRFRCSKLEPFVTQKSGHIWRIWAEMTQTLMPKLTKVAPIHLPECNSPKFAKFPPKFATICQISAKIRQISFHKRALTLNTHLFVPRTTCSRVCCCSHNSFSKEGKQAIAAIIYTKAGKDPVVTAEFGPPSPISLNRPLKGRKRSKR